MNNIDAVATQVAPSGIQVQGFLDAAALVDIAPTGWPWSPDLIPLQTLMQTMVEAVGSTFEPACSQAFPGAESYKCLIGQYRMPLLRTQVFINAPQYDDFEIMYDTDNLAPVTAAQLNFVNEFQPAVLALIASMPQNTGVFSSTCLLHVRALATKIACACVRRDSDLRFSFRCRSVCRARRHTTTCW